MTNQNDKSMPYFTDKYFLFYLFCFLISIISVSYQYKIYFQLSGRAKQHVKERQRLANALSSGVSNEGVKLYLAITKT